jgi:hypothetical protein
MPERLMTLPVADGARTGVRRADLVIADEAVSTIFSGENAPSKKQSSDNPAALDDAAGTPVRRRSHRCRAGTAAASPPTGRSSLRKNQSFGPPEARLAVQLVGDVAVRQPGES